MFIVPTSNELPQMTAQPDAVAHHAKLMKAAQEFEAMMLEVIMKPLGKSAAIDGDPDDASTSGPLQSFGLNAMAGALAKSGALGFAGRIAASVEKHSQKQSVPKSNSGDS